MSKSVRQDGWWYPWVFVGGFVVIITVNAIMAYIAVDSWTGIETEHAFQKGQEFNQRLAQQSAQNELGWVASTKFIHTPTADNPRAGTLHLNYKDASGLGVDGLSVEALAVRPTHEGYDREVKFVGTGNGAYLAPTTLPLAGQWELRITSTRGEDIFKLRQRIQVP